MSSQRGKWTGFKVSDVNETGARKIAILVE